MCVLYLLIGFLFTILRSNSHYDYLINRLEDNGKSYWENRCIAENRNKVYATPGAYWCEDGSGKFHTEKPSEYEWYFMFYSKENSNFIITLLLWPIHFIGIDIIHFRSVANVF